MNKSNIEHLVFGLIAQAAIWIVTGSLWLGFAFVTGLFLGREHAQFEYTLNDPPKIKRHKALAFWKWSTDAKIDFALPVLITSLVAVSADFI